MNAASLPMETVRAFRAPAATLAIAVAAGLCASRLGRAISQRGGSRHFRAADSGYVWRAWRFTASPRW